MQALKNEYQFQYVLLRYVPDFARDEFVNGGIVLHDAQHHVIMGKVSRNPKIYKCIDREKRYMLFVESTERLIEGLREDVQEIKKGEQEKVPELVEEAFLRSIIPNAGFYDYSNIRSGITDDIDEEFAWLYRRFVDDTGKDIEKKEMEDKESAIDVVHNLLESMSQALKQQPVVATFDYKATGRTYRFEVSFGPPENIYMKVLGMQVRKERKKGTPDLRNVLQISAVLSAMKREHPSFTFGVILHVPSNLMVDIAQETVSSAKFMIEDAGLNVVVASRSELEMYFRRKKLLR